MKKYTQFILLTLSKFKKYIKQNLIAIDQLLNALLGGYADETLSSRAYRSEKNNKPFGKILRPIIDLIFLVFFWDHQHCYNSWLSEKNRKHLPANF